MNSLFTQTDLNKLQEQILSKITDASLQNLCFKVILSDRFEEKILSNPSTELIKGNGRSTAPRMEIARYFINHFPPYIKNEYDLTWENYCKIMHDLTYKLSRHNRPTLYVMFSQLFKIASVEAKTEQMQSYLTQYSHLFLEGENSNLIKNRSGAEKDSFIQNNVRTFFPLDSKINQIVQKDCFSARDKIPFKANFIIKSENHFLKELISGYLEYYSNYKNFRVNGIYNRIFITFFEDSLEANKIRNLSDFTQGTFQQQLAFYNNFFDDDTTEKENFAPFGLLVKFYRYIDELNHLTCGSWLFTSTSFNRNILTKTTYQNSLEEGYFFTSINPLEDYPNEDKWFVTSGKGTSNIKEQENHRFDFTKVSNIELRNDLKRFIWNYQNKLAGKKNYFSFLVDFLNQADEYVKDQNDKVLFLNRKEKPRIFSNDFLLFYHADIYGESDFADKTKNSKVDALRAFLNYFQDKYTIPTAVIKELTYLADYDEGGNPIAEEDWVEIVNLFKSNIDNLEDELLFIAFQLAGSTKLRLSEIFSLRRNCIVLVNEKSGFGTIQYYSKTSSDELIEASFTLDKIRLIEKAKRLSQSAYETASEDLKDYIFIGFSKFHSNQIVALRNKFTEYFSKIVTTLFEDNKIKKLYRPYNLRHTVINTVWQGVEDGVISTFEVGELTGNSPIIAHKHYREKWNTDRYVEAMWEVSIETIEPIGTIMERELEIEDLPPVQNGAGGCSSTGCIKKESVEDSSFKCLTCRKFVTTVERIPIFEKLMDLYKQKRDTASSINQESFYKVMHQLYGAYLSEMYALREENYG